MGILIYQIGIFLAIQLSTFYGGKSTRNVAIILISIFTILQVYTNQLMILQFITIFISYLVSRNILGKSNGETIDTIIEEVDNLVSGNYDSTSNITKRTKESTLKAGNELDDINNEESLEWVKQIHEKIVNSKKQDILETDNSDSYKVYQIIKLFIEHQNKNVPKKGYHPNRVQYDNMENEFKLFAQTSRNYKKFINVLNSLDEGRELKDFMNWNKKVNTSKHEIYMVFIYKFFKKKK